MAAVLDAKGSSDVGFVFVSAVRTGMGPGEFATAGLGVDVDATLVAVEGAENLLKALDGIDGLDGKAITFLMLVKPSNGCVFRTCDNPGPISTACFQPVLENLDF